MRELTYATVCSGVECMSVAALGLQLRPVFFSEIEPFPCAVLKSNYPNIPNLGDMSRIEVSEDGKEITNGTARLLLDARLDILAGGTPCQDVSVAGRRRGMQEGSGTRSSLAFEFVRLIRGLRPRWVVWENVAGVLSDESFPAFLREIGKCGYACGWRTLDAQYVRVDGMERAVPQRRRRVWVVGRAGGDASGVAEILFEPDCVVGHTPPRRIAGQGFAYTLEGRDSVHGGVVGGAPGDGGCVSCTTRQISLATSEQVAGPVISTDYKEPQCIALDGDKLKPRTDQRKGGNGFGVNEDGAGYTLTSADRHGVAYNASDVQSKRIYSTEGVAPCLPSGGGEGMTIQPSVLIKRTWHDGSDTAASLTTGGANQFMPDKGRFDAVVECYENHAQDSRVKPIEVAPTFGASNANSMGVSGNNPLVAFNKVSHARKSDGEGERWDEGDVASTRNTFDIGDKRAQEVVVHSTNFNGGDVMPTISAKECKNTQKQKNLSGGYVIHHISAEVISVMRYIVRRLTPTECERLMGLPDGWTIPSNLAIIDELVDEFRQIHDNFNRIMWEYSTKDDMLGDEDENGDLPKRPPPKPKTAKQVRKWLEKITNPDTCPDSSRYKACGNGWATNQPRWILTRLLTKEGIEWQDHQATDPTP